MSEHASTDGAALLGRGGGADGGEIPDTAPLLSGRSQPLSLDIPASTSGDNGERTPDQQTLPWWHRSSPRTPRTSNGRSPRSSTLAPIAGDFALEDELGWSTERVGFLRNDDDARPEVSLGELYSTLYPNP